MKTRVIVAGVLLIIVIATVALLVAGRPASTTIPSREISFAELEQATQTAIQNSKMRDKDGTPLLVDPEFQIYILEQADEYQISYQGAYKIFHISILGPSFEDAKARAENAFLRLLNAPREVACALSVKVTTPAFANPEEAGQTFGLSFCPSSQ